MFVICARFSGQYAKPLVLIIQCERKDSALCELLVRYYAFCGGLNVLIYESQGAKEKRRLSRPTLRNEYVIQSENQTDSIMSYGTYDLIQLCPARTAFVAFSLEFRELRDWSLLHQRAE